MSDGTTIEPPETFEALKDRLIEIEPSLPKRLRQAAAYALEHPDEFALGTASGIARNADVQASTLVRFAQSLGFGGFSDLQEVFRSHLRKRWPDYSERLKVLHETARDSGDPLNLLMGFANSAALLARPPARSGRPARSRPGDRPARPSQDHLLPRPAAQLRRRALPELRPRPARPFRVSDRQRGRARAGAARPGRRGDALIAISFAPYSPVTVDLARRARRAKTPTVVVTDSALSPLAGLADVRFEIVESDFGSFRSLAATFCLAMTLAVAVGERRA